MGVRKITELPRLNLDRLNIEEARRIYMAGGIEALEQSYATSNEVVRQIIAKIGLGSTLAAKSDRASVQPTGRPAGGRKDYAGEFDRVAKKHREFAESVPRNAGNR